LNSVVWMYAMLFNNDQMFAEVQQQPYWTYSAIVLA
jgi:hypothetical protein